MNSFLKSSTLRKNMMRHIQELFRHIQAYFETRVTLKYLEPWYIQNAGIFTTLAYSEPRYIQNADIFKNRDIFRTISNTYDEAFCENS